MQTSTDHRHQRRQQAVKDLFEWWFYKDQPAQQASITQRLNRTAPRLALETLKHLAEIDKLIRQAAPEWPLAGIARVDLSILRLAIYELLFGTTAPLKVIIDEAVELAKELGGQASPAFVNGVLGKIVTVQGLKPQLDATEITPCGFTGTHGTPPS